MLAENLCVVLIFFRSFQVNSLQTCMNPILLQPQQLRKFSIVEIPFLKFHNIILQLKFLQLIQSLISRYSLKDFFEIFILMCVSTLLVSLLFLARVYLEILLSVRLCLQESMYLVSSHLIGIQVIISSKLVWKLYS